MTLVPNFRQAWKWFSVQAAMLIALLQVAWETLPPEAVNVIPTDWRGYITLGLAVLVIVGRVIDQGGAKA